MFKKKSRVVMELINVVIEDIPIVNQKKLGGDDEPIQADDKIRDSDNVNTKIEEDSDKEQKDPIESSIFKNKEKSSIRFDHWRTR
jgi:hypothetical protein